MRTTLAMLAATALLLSACSGLQASATSSEEASDGATAASMEDAGLAYAQCMRDNGIDMPDPQGDGGRVELRLPDGVDPESDSFQRAEEECREHLEGAVQNRMENLSPEEQERLQEQMLALAECMREHGIDMPDPQIGQGGLRIGGPGGDLDPRDPEVREALEACQDEVGMQLPRRNGGRAEPEGGQ